MVSPVITVEMAEHVLSHMEHLPPDEVTLVLHTDGGEVTACVLIADALRKFTRSTAIVPYMALLRRDADRAQRDAPAARQERRPVCRRPGDRRSAGAAHPEERREEREPAAPARAGVRLGGARLPERVAEGPSGHGNQSRRRSSAPCPRSWVSRRRIRGPSTRSSSATWALLVEPADAQWSRVVDDLRRANPRKKYFVLGAPVESPEGCHESEPGHQGAGEARDGAIAATRGQASGPRRGGP
jgi:hypothetical protein